MAWIKKGSKESKQAKIVKGHYFHLTKFTYTLALLRSIRIARSIQGNLIMDAQVFPIHEAMLVTNPSPPIPAVG